MKYAILAILLFCICSNTADAQLEIMNPFYHRERNRAQNAFQKEKQRIVNENRKVARMNKVFNGRISSWNSIKSESGEKFGSPRSWKGTNGTTVEGVLSSVTGVNAIILTYSSTVRNRNSQPDRFFKVKKSELSKEDQFHLEMFDTFDKRPNKEKDILRCDSASYRVSKLVEWQRTALRNASQAFQQLFDNKECIVVGYHNREDVKDILGPPTGPEADILVWKASEPKSGIEILIRVTFNEDNLVEEIDHENWDLISPIWRSLLSLFQSKT